MNPASLMYESEKKEDQSTSKQSLTEKIKSPSIDTILKKRTIQVQTLQEQIKEQKETYDSLITDKTN